MKKRFVSILLILAQFSGFSYFPATMGGVPFAFAGEEQVTPDPQVTPSISEGSIELAQEEVFGLLGQLMEGGKEKGAVLVEFGNLVKRWGERGVAEEALISSWNSYLILFARLAVESYQAALWGSPSDKDPEILSAYGEMLKRLGFSSEILKRHRRGTESFSKASEIFKFLKERRDFILAIGGKETEGDFDLSEVKYFELSEEQLDQWDLYLGKHELSSGEEMPNQMYRAKLLSAWEGHHKALQGYVESVERRGFWEMLQGALRGDREDPNQMEIEGATRLLGQYRMQMLRLGVSEEMIQEMLKKEKEAHKYAALLFDEDISQLKWATVGVAMAPLIPVSMSVGVALGLSAKASAVMAGIPMLVMGIKGAGSFVIQGLFNKEHFSGAKFYNDMMPGLTSALPFSAVIPLCAGGITAIATTEAASTTMIAKTGISAGQALTAGSFYILIGYGVIRGGASAGEGILEVVRRDAERGTLLIWDGTVDIAASLLFLKIARPQSAGGKEGEKFSGGGTGGAGRGAAPLEEGGGCPPCDRTRALPASEGNISPHTQNHSVRGSQRSKPSATTVALLEEPATLKDLLEIPETLPPDDILLGQTSPQSRFGARASDRQNIIFIDRNSGQIRQFVLPKTESDDPDVVDLRGSSFVPVITEAPAITRRVAEPQDTSNGEDSPSLTTSDGKFFLSDEWEFNPSSYLQGGMGRVYKVRHKKTREARAVKVSKAKDPNLNSFWSAWPPVINVEALEAQAKYEQEKSRNVIEALVTAEVGNVRVFEFGVSAIKKERIIEKGQPYIVMEWIEGEDLDDYIVSHHPNVREGAELLLKITRILKAYHDRGFVHRDLKPANIRIDRSGGVFILDNGLALILPNPIQPSLLNPQMNPVEADDLSFGTANYISPEAVFVGRDAYSGKMDIWSLALVWHELMTGRDVGSFVVPQNQTHSDYLITDPGFVQQLINNLPNDLPQNLRRLFQEMLSETPNQRPSVEKITSELESFLGPEIPETQSLDSKFRSVDIHGVNKIDDLFPPPLRNNGTKIVSLGCGQTVLWERKLEDTYGVSVTGIDRHKTKPYAGRAKELRGGYIVGDFLTMPSKRYDMVILNSPRINWIESEPNNNFSAYGIAVERFLNPGGMGIILSEFTDGEDPVQALEKIFGPGNVRRLPAIEGYHLGLRKWQQPVSLQSNGDFFIVKKAPTSPSEN